MSLYDHGGDVFGTARRMGADPERLIDFSASINPLGMPEGVRKAVYEAVNSLIHYPDPFAEPLRGAFALYHGVAPEEIAPGNGSSELIFLIPRLFKAGRGLIVAPAFSEYAKSLAASGWETCFHILSPDDGFKLDIDALRKRLAGGYDILFLCNPGNPSGRLYTKGEVLLVADLCRDSGTFFVLDEAFVDFCGEQFSCLKEIVCSGTGMVLRSLTKFYAIPGLRLGYAAAAAEICRQLLEIRAPWGVNSLAQAAGLAATKDSGFRCRTMELVKQERSHLFRILSELPWLSPIDSEANYLLVAVDGTVPVSELCRKLLLKHNILVRDCSSFAGLEKGFIRVAVRSAEENSLLVESLKHLLPL